MIQISSQNELKEIYPLMHQLRVELDFEAFAKKFKLASKTQNYKLFGFKQDSSFVAACGVMPFNVLYRDFCLYICDFVVNENLRGKGFGQKCLTQIHKWAKDEGYKEIELSSSFPRVRAHEFYTQKMGYEKTSFVFRKKL